MKKVLFWIARKLVKEPDFGRVYRWDAFYPNVSQEGKKHQSVDVIALDDKGLMYIVYYNYEIQEWGFHTTFLGECPGSFVWMYPPEYLSIS